MHCTPLNGKFERKEQEKKRTLLEANERASEQHWQRQWVFRYSIFLCVCTYRLCVRCRSFYSYSYCMDSEKEKKRRRKKRERRARVHINVLQHCTLDNYDLWPKRMRAENIILSKDSHCHWSIVNNNINNNINNNNSKSIDIEHWSRYFVVVFFLNIYIYILIH